VPEYWITLVAYCSDRLQEIWHWYGAASGGRNRHFDRSRRNTTNIWII